MTAAPRRYRPRAKANRYVAIGMVSAAIVATFWWLAIFIGDQHDYTAAHNQQLTLMRMFDQTSSTDGPRDDAVRAYRQKLARQLLQVPAEIGRQPGAETVWVAPEKLAIIVSTGDPLDLGATVEVPGWGHFFGGLIWPIGFLVYCAGGLALLLVWRGDTDANQRLLDLDWDYPSTKTFAALSLPVLVPCLVVSYLRTREFSAAPRDEKDGQAKATKPAKTEQATMAAESTPERQEVDEPTVYTSPVGKFMAEE